ncbi:MAG: hypothetical protein NT123_24790 [Proteobacteria bacterium]|nr:hypothetical protein [Pseudomonadota bacterium]
MSDAELQKLLEDAEDDDGSSPFKYLAEILADGIHDTPGLRMLAFAELNGEYFGPIPNSNTEDEMCMIRAFLDHMAKVGPTMTAEERHRVVEDFGNDMRNRREGRAITR